MRLNLRARLGLIMGLSFLPAVAAIVFDHIDRQKREIESATHDIELSALLAAEFYRGRLENVRHALIALAQWEAIKTGSTLEGNRVLSETLPRYPQFNNIGVITPNGKLWSSALPFHSPVNLEDRSYFKRAMESGDFSVGDYQVGRVTGKPSLALGYPVKNKSGQITRVIFASLDLGFLIPISDPRSSVAGSRLTLIDSNRVVLSKTSGREVGSVLDFPIPVSLGSRDRVSWRTRDRVFGLAPVSIRKSSQLTVVVDVEIDDIVGAAQIRLWKKLGWLLFSLLVAVALCGRVGTFLITRHIEHLLATLKRLTGGDFSARVHPSSTSGGELRDLADRIDEMADSLQARDAALRQSHAQLEKQVHDRTQELTEANQQLESFTYSISHDLRAPLRAIDGFSQILLNEHAHDLLPEGKRLLDRVVGNSKHMAHLIEDLLAFSRLGRQDVLKSELNLEELAREVFLELTTPAPSKQIDMTIRPLPQAWGDRSMMHQVYYNLLENALKYSSRVNRPTVEVGARPGPEGNVFYVKDNGVGFDPHHAGRLFQVFQRLHASEDFSGTGVGLAIVHRIVRKHGGRVWAESIPNQGATFFFTIPPGGNSST